MGDVQAIIFLLTVGFLTTHELDAIANHEWRIFPFTAPLSDQLGYQVFVAAHVPLFALIVWLAPYETFRIVFDVFAVVHVGLHWMFRNHPQYEFDSGLSRGLIVGAGVFGMAHLILLML